MIKHEIVPHLMILPPLRPLPLRSFRSTDIWHCVSSRPSSPRLSESRAPSKKTNPRRSIFNSHVQHVSRKDTFPDWEAGTRDPATGRKFGTIDAGAESNEHTPAEHQASDAVTSQEEIVKIVDSLSSEEDLQTVLDDEREVISDDHPLALDHYGIEANEDTQHVSSQLKSDFEWVTQKHQKDPSLEEFTAAQLEHQLQLDTDADRLGRIIRGPLKIYRSDTVQQKTLKLLNRHAHDADLPSVISDPSPALSENESQLKSVEENLNGPTATLLRLQMLASDGAFDLERTFRVAFEDDVGRVPQDKESKTSKAARLLNQPSMHDLVVSRFAARPGPRYEATFMSTLSRKIRAADQLPNEGLLWTALNTAALAHAPEAVGRYLFALGIDLNTHVRTIGTHEQLSLPSDVFINGSRKTMSKMWTNPVPTALTPSRLAELVGNLKTGFSNGSAFARSSRHPEAMIKLLEVLFDKLRMQGWSTTTAMFSHWRVLYPWVWTLSECGAGDRIQAIWNFLCRKRWAWPVEIQLANFFIHMLFRAGDPARAWSIYDRQDLRLQQSNGGLHEGTPADPKIYQSQQYLTKALVAHIEHAPDIKDQSLRRRFAAAIIEHYEDELERIEKKMGIHWFPTLGYHVHTEERGLRGIAVDLEPSSQEPEYNDMPTTRHQLPGFISRPLFKNKWPAADDTLGSFLSVGEREVHDTDFLAWQNLPSFLRSTDELSSDELSSDDVVCSVPLPASQTQRVRDWRKSVKKKVKRREARRWKADSRDGADDSMLGTWKEMRSLQHNSNSAK